jgi:hypothetical protein
LESQFHANVWVSQRIGQLALTEGCNPFGLNIYNFSRQISIEVEASALRDVGAQGLHIVIHGQAVGTHRFSFQGVSCWVETWVAQTMLFHKMVVQCFTVVKVLHANFTTHGMLSRCCSFMCASTIDQQEGQLNPDRALMIRFEKRMAKGAWRLLTIQVG